MYLAGKLGIFDKKGHSWKLLPVILPLFLAIFVGVTRIDDYWHHWTDVFAGALLGECSLVLNPFLLVFSILICSVQNVIAVGLIILSCTWGLNHVYSKLGCFYMFLALWRQFVAYVILLFLPVKSMSCLL
jgi:hypothetical protein